MLHFSPARRGNVQLLSPADELYAALVNRASKLTFRARVEDDALALPLQEGEGVEPLADEGASPSTTGENETESAPADAIESPEIEDAPAQRFDQASEVLVEAEPLPRAEPAPPRAELQTDLRATQLANALYALRSHARSALEEQGVNVLFLSFGLLHWQDAVTQESVQSPLLLVPVQLERTSISQPFTLQLRDEEILLNPTLAHKLALDYGVNLPRLPEDGDAIIPSAVLVAVAESVPDFAEWSVTPDIYLELYSFEKLVMLKDLDAHARELSEHPLVQALAGDPSQLPPPPPDLPTAGELDERTTPAEVFQVLDADSSQQVAIEWSKRGASFVIQGPPGTGKSQTIANLIAEALAQNKRVLFVSAKMAALEVVHKRLAECGLGHLCLKAHSHRAARGAFVAELGRALYDPVAVKSPPLEHLRELQERRAELNAYARALRAPIAPLGQSPLEAYGALAQLLETPDLHFEFPVLMQVDARRFSEIRARLENIAALGAVWDGAAENLWREVALTAYTYRERTEIERQFGELIQRTSRLEPAANQVSAALALPARSLPWSLTALGRLARIGQHALATPTPLTDWFRAGQTDELRHLAHSAQALYAEQARQRAAFTAEYDETLLERTDLAAMRARLEAAQGNNLRFLDATWREDMRVLRRAARAETTPPIPELAAALARAEKLQSLNAQIHALEPELQTRLGRMFRGAATAWQELDAALAWVDELVALFAPESVPEQLISLVCNRPARLYAAKPSVDELAAMMGELQPKWAYLEQLFPTRADFLCNLPLSDLRAWLAMHIERLDELEPWLGLEAECAALDRFGLGGFLHSARAAHLEGVALQSAFLKRFYQLWLDAVYAQYPPLRVSGEVYRKQVAHFARQDVEQLQIARERLRQQWADARPQTAWSDAPSSEVTLLKRELAKRKHHKSIRRLLAEIPNLLLTLKPCLMMSPLSVSQYLAAAPVTFDLVIFDEASQIPPEEAIAAVMRARQMIVAGDDQQLPPTPFFETLDESPAEDDDRITLESLLQQAAVVLPRVQLMWHYRSRHEALLAFSNHHLYGDRLLTFPNAAVHDAQLGVSFVHVPDGIYDRARTRTNPIEARRVAQLVVEHLRATPARSLGVVTFSQPQRAAIDLELQILLRAHPELEAALGETRGEPFFVKSLENVQGDERDVMFFSVGYGRDPEGALALNFGPLNGQDGARRLNVAITRAREQVQLVSSLLPADLDPARLNSRGVRLLRDYMEYCLRGGRTVWLGESDMGASATEDSERTLAAEVCAALQARGLTVHSEVGRGNERIDLAILDPENPERYVLGIELEGTAFRDAKTARERERLRAQVLERLGWRMHRVRARDWVTNPTAQVEQIVQQLSSLDAPADAWTSREPGNGGDQRSFAPLGARAATRALVATGTALYTPTALARLGTPEQFFGANDELFDQIFTQLAEQEGPIHWNAVVRRTAACWGIPRVTPAVEQHLDAVLSQLVERQRVVLRDDFLWSPVTMDVLVRQPAPGQAPRPIEEIALEEIAKAAYLNLQNAFSLTAEDWVLATARLFGYARPGERVKRRIETAMARLAANGLARRENGKWEWQRPALVEPRAGE